jgi:hypothetical protein
VAVADAEPVETRDSPADLEGVAGNDCDRDPRLEAESLSAILPVLVTTIEPLGTADEAEERETLGDADEERDGLGVVEGAFDAVAGKILSYIIKDSHPALATNLPELPVASTTAAVGIVKQLEQTTSNRSCEFRAIL